MASQGYRDWLRAGRPYALIRPAAAVQATLRGYGLTVYDYPNDAHLQASAPEDHTPYSVTGWPGTNKRWHGRGLDVMPRGDTAADRAENAAIARQVIRDRDAGVPGTMWIKYLNWTDEAGVCRQERWTDATRPLHRDTRTSTDDGHIHISGRSDADDDARADGYDPIARMRGTMTGDDVNLSDSNPFGSKPTQFTTEKGVEPGPWLGGTVGNQLQYLREDGHFTRAMVRGLTAQVAALGSVIETMARAFDGSGEGGSLDVGLILAGVDERLAKLAAEQRDAVADLGEGGAAQVRADAD